MNEDEMRELFREMREEPLPVDSLARVRLRVDQEIRKTRWLTSWKIAAALVMAGCLLAGFVLLRPVKTPVQTQPPRPPEIAQMLPPPETPVRTTPRPRRARPRPAKVEPVLIRIETPDPDVVILLVN